MMSECPHSVQTESTYGSEYMQEVPVLLRLKMEVAVVIALTRKLLRALKSVYVLRRRSFAAGTFYLHVHPLTQQPRYFTALNILFSTLFRISIQLSSS